MSTTYLARITNSADEPNAEHEATVQYLTFVAGRELYALPIGMIREVIEFPGLTRIPLAPPAMPGVINLRGAVVPVVDLSVRLGRAATPMGTRTCVVVVEAAFDEGLQPLGLIVDAVSEALEVDASQVERRPSFGTGLRSDFVAAMLKVDDRFVIVLETANVLSVAALERLASGSSEAAKHAAVPS